MSTTADPQIADLQATQLIEHYRRGTLSPVEVTEAVLRHIAERGAALNAFVLLDPEAALSAARASEARIKSARIKSGQPLRLLEGVPCSVKDLLPARGWPTRRGSLTTSSEGPWDIDAPAVARLREEGALLLGKTTTSEFGLKGLGDSPLTGITRNPWHLGHSPGGSSAGAVAAVAAGFGPLAVGTDGGGSIRVPSAYSGVVGLKASFGRVATVPPGLSGVPPHVGPIARSVDDVVLLLRVLAKSDPRDVWSLGHRPFEAVRESLRGLRIAYSKDLGYARVHPEIEAAFARAVLAFRELGAELVEAHPQIASPAGTLQVFFQARAAETVRTLSADERARLDPEVERAAQAGEQLSASELSQAESERLRLIDSFAKFQARFDLLLTPSSVLTAPHADAGAAPYADEVGIERVSLAAPFSLTRQPALSVPCGLSARGLPIGLQIVGRHFEEDLVLGAAAALERIAPFNHRPTYIAQERTT